MTAVVDPGRPRSLFSTGWFAGPPGSGVVIFLPHGRRGARVGLRRLRGVLRRFYADMLSAWETSS